MNNLPNNEAESLLDRIRIVLVHPQHPGNIGSAARVMKNMGLMHLRLVQPRLFPDKEATTMASGADDVLEQAEVFDDLDAALADCTYVAGTSARPRYLSQPVFTPREWTAQLPDQGRIALLFGRERVGLLNEEIQRCQQLIAIPTNPSYASLNLASAVQVLAYELRLADDDRIVRPVEHVPVDQAQMQYFYTHLEQVLTQIRFLDPENPRLLMQRMRLLYDRAAPDHNEMNILRGILKQTEFQLARLAAASSGGAKHD